MGIKIHGAATSTCTRRVLTTLVEKGVPYEFVPVDFGVGEHKTSRFMELQPFGKVPVLEDDGYFLYESRAMAKYIARKYAGQGTELMPDNKDLKAYGLFEQACSLEYCYFDAPAAGIAFEKVFKPLYGYGDTDEAKLAEYLAKVDSTFAVYEGILSKQEYLAGGTLTLADLSHLPYGEMVKKDFPALYEKYPHVDKWFKGLQARESWIKVNS